MDSVGTRSSLDEISGVEEETRSFRKLMPAQEQKPLCIASYDAVNRENFRGSENEEPATMDSISSFLETMHSKNLTLKKLAKVQQRRIDELSRENKALRQASEMKDEEILRIKSHLSTLCDEPVHADPPESAHSPAVSQKGSSSRNTACRQDRSCTPKTPATATNGITEQSKKGSSVERHKPSIIVSHKVAVRRVMRLVRKINGAYNRKSVGLYTFVHGFAHVLLSTLVSISRDAPSIVYVHCAYDKS